MVGRQPFGGNRLSGTGTKAGGAGLPAALRRAARRDREHGPARPRGLGPLAALSASAAGSEAPCQHSTTSAASRTSPTPSRAGSDHSPSRPSARSPGWRSSAARRAGPGHRGRHRHRLGRARIDYALQAPPPAPARRAPRLSRTRPPRPFRRPPRPPTPTPPTPPRPDGADDHVSREAVLVAESADAGAAEGAGAQIRVGEPWEGYGKLTAKEVNDRLATASPASLAVARPVRDRQP